MNNASLNDMAEAYKTRLQQLFPDLEVDHYPDDPRSYQLAHAKGAVLITLQSRQFEPGAATDGSIQNNRPVFQITFLSRSLVSKKDNPGAYDMLDTARDGLKTLELGLGNVSIHSEFFIQVAPGGVWYYGQTWQHSDVFY